jgi:hypothetical protein
MPAYEALLHSHPALPAHASLAHALLHAYSWTHLLPHAGAHAMLHSHAGTLTSRAGRGRCLRSNKNRRRQCDRRNHYS